MSAWLAGSLVTAVSLAAIDTAAPPGVPAPQIQPVGPQLPPPALPGSAAADSADAALFASPTRLDHIGRIVAPVMINGRGPFRFIVDTGATHSTISPALAARLGLQPNAEASVEVNGITGTARVPGVTVAKLQAGDLSIEDTNFPVVWAPLMAGADGILGAAGLQSQRLLVDFRHNRVVIYRASRRSTPSGFMRVPARRLGAGLVTVEAVVGGVPVRAVIDTGSERSLGNLALLEALRARHPHSSERRQLANVYGATMEVVSGDAQMAPTIVIDALRITDATLVYGDFHIFKVWDMQDKPALIIGMDILGTVDALTIDFHHADVFFASAALRNAARERDGWKVIGAQ
jgi:predicted aspartyl protease